MRLSVIVATLEGCPFRELDDPALVDRVLTEAVAAGGFTLLHRHVHRFEPQGVTGAAVLSESHLALHSWPEDGVLFVDLATCSGEAAARRAFARICALVPHARVREQGLGYAGRGEEAAWRADPPAPRPAVAARRTRSGAVRSGGAVFAAWAARRLRPYFSGASSWKPTLGTRAQSAVASPK